MEHALPHSWAFVNGDDKPDGLRMIKGGTKSPLSLSLSPRLRNDDYMLHPWRCANINGVAYYGHRFGIVRVCIGK